jgi:hypothetical protein
MRMSGSYPGLSLEATAGMRRPRNVSSPPPRSAII